MSYNIEDLKGRALVESNILKQFILSDIAKGKGEFKPRMEDILIHNYQIANSVTLNVILSNYMVDLAYAVNYMRNPSLVGGHVDSYFQLLRGTEPLDDHTRLVLDVHDGNGAFYTSNLAIDANKIWDDTYHATQFINLDTLWYYKKTENGHDTISLVGDEMNMGKSNPFGENPFDKPLYVGNEEENPTGFNQWMAENENTLNCIVENRFYRNVFGDEGGFA